MGKAQEAADKGRTFLEHKRDDVISILRTAQRLNSDQFLTKLLEEAEKINPPTRDDFIAYLQPSGRMISRDMIALNQGIWTPPHISVLADIAHCGTPKKGGEKLAAIVRRAFSHLERTQKRLRAAERVGTNVFIGHGRSKEWKDLKDFIVERMRLPWDDFNRMAVAGIPNTERLSTMLDAAAIAFLVFTAEDERADGQFQARMNVVHEAGLFQGRLGFNRAIVMLEQGCAEFSNIAGLGQIRFPKVTFAPRSTMCSLYLSVRAWSSPPKNRVSIIVFPSGPRIGPTCRNEHRSGAACRGRTDDLKITNLALYQLS